ECLPGLIVHLVIQNAVGDRSWAQGNEKGRTGSERDDRSVSVLRRIDIYFVDKRADLATHTAGIDLDEVWKNPEHHELNLHRSRRGNRLQLLDGGNLYICGHRDFITRGIYCNAIRIGIRAWPAGTGRSALPITAPKAREGCAAFMA